MIFTESKNIYNILFTNNFGNLIESKKCPIKPEIYAINSEYLIVSDRNYIYLLIFKGNASNNKNNKDKSISSLNISNVGKNMYNNSKLDNRFMKEFVFFIDDKSIIIIFIIIYINIFIINKKHEFFHESII